MITRTRILGATAIVAMLMMVTGSALANVTITAATGGGAISADTAGGTFTSLTGPTISEGAVADISVGNVVIALPAGFEYDTTSSVTISAIPTTTSLRLDDSVGCASTGTTIAVTPSANAISFSVCASSLAAGKRTTLSFAGLSVRPTNGTPLASGDITVSASSTATIGGVTAGSTSLGALAEVPGALAGVVVDPATPLIGVGQTQQFTGQAVDAFGNARPDAIVWAADPGAGTIDAAGLFSATTAGSFPGGVTATAGSVVGSADLTIAAIDHLVLDPATATITAGQSQAFTAEGFDASNNSLGDRTAATTFTISPDGSCTGATCTADTAGPHTITGTDGLATGTATVDVVADAIDHIVVSPDGASVVAGVAQAFTAEGFDQFNNSVGDRTSTTTFSIGPDGSCTLDSCTATVAGAHTVTGTLGSLTDDAAVSVVAAALDHLTLDPPNGAIVAGGSQVYTVAGFDEFNNPVGDRTATSTLSISPDGSCAADTCTASTVGAHTVTATDGTATGSTGLSVTTAPLASVVVSPATATITAGDSQAFTAEGFDSFGNSLGDQTASATFAITPDGSCTADVCTATTAGSHTVTATVGTVSGTAALDVVAAALDHITVSPDGATLVAGASQAFTAEGFDAFGNSVGDRTVTTVFSIGPDGSCTLDTCTATVAGAHTITGTDGLLTDTATITVDPAAFDHPWITPQSSTIAAGGSQTYVVRGRDAYDNDTGDVTSLATLTIAPNGSCTGDTCTASVTGLHAVLATIGSTSDQADLNITPAAPDYLILSPATATIPAGSSQAYTAEAFDSMGNSLGDVTDSTTFSIAPNGACAGSSCSATAAGTKTVTADFEGAGGGATLDIVAAAYDHFEITPAASSIAAGTSQTYAATGYDRYNNPTGDVSGSTLLSITPNGSCSGSSCTATAAGAHTVTARRLGQIRQASLTVTAAALDHLVLSPETSSIASGGTKAFTANGFDAYGNPLGNRTATTTFTISPDGSCTGAVCTATLAGAHTVTGTDGTATGTATLSVVSGAPTSITLTASPTTVARGGSSTLTATLKDAAGNLVTGQIVTFRLSQTDSGGPVGLPVGGPRVTPSATTGAAGTATATYTAGLLTGTDRVTATIGGLSASVSIDVTLS